MYDVDFDRLIENYKIFSIKMDRKTVRHAFPHKSVSYIYIYYIIYVYMDSLMFGCQKSEGF